MYLRRKAIRTQVLFCASFTLLLVMAVTVAVVRAAPGLQDRSENWGKRNASQRSVHSLPESPTELNSCPSTFNILPPELFGPGSILVDCPMSYSGNCSQIPDHTVRQVFGTPQMVNWIYSRNGGTVAGAIVQYDPTCKYAPVFNMPVLGGLIGPCSFSIRGCGVMMPKFGRSIFGMWATDGATSGLWLYQNDK